ncbi:hypothetical protein GCM10019016_108660 [Streptomyces prasinosporus]|uniref:Uncharacterized protein n=1 Tax=Streptomyces prasinosporus TaxID=68256 RepID=A0ABP6UA04_9ACTN
MPKVPWRVGRVVNTGPLTSLFPRIGPKGGARAGPGGSGGAGGPPLPLPRKAIDHPAPLLPRLRHGAGAEGARWSRARAGAGVPVDGGLTAHGGVESVSGALRTGTSAPRP